MPQNLSDYDLWKEFNWEGSRSLSDLKGYIKYVLETNRVLQIKSPETRRLDSLEHDLNIRKDYERLAEQTQAQLKELLEAWGAEVAIPGEGGLMFSRAVEKNIEKLKPAAENWLEQELTTERETTQQVLQTSQTWHERQKAEIIAEWKDKVFQLKAKLTNLLNTRKQKITQELNLIKEVLNE